MRLKGLSYCFRSACLTWFFAGLLFHTPLKCALAGQIAVAGKPLEEFHVAYGAVNASAVPLWIAHELGFFERYGLRAHLIYINSASRVLAAMMAGDIHVAQSSVGAVVAAYPRSDAVLIGGGVNKINVSIYGLPEIREPRNLEGKKLGITRFGGLYDFSARYALAKWKLQPAKDVVLIQVGDIPSLMLALAANAIQAATLQPPSSIRARQLGYRELMDLSRAGLEYQTSALITTRSMIIRSPVRLGGFMRAFSEGLAVFHNQKEAALKVMGKYLTGMDPRILEETYRENTQWIPRVPYVNHAGMETAINLTPGMEQASRPKVQDLVDESFVKELDQQGVYRTLYGKR